MALFLSTYVLYVYVINVFFFFFFKLLLQVHTVMSHGAVSRDPKPVTPVPVAQEVCTLVFLELYQEVLFGRSLICCLYIFEVLIINI